MATGSGKTVVMAMLVAWDSEITASTREPRVPERGVGLCPNLTVKDGCKCSVRSADLSPKTPCSIGAPRVVTG
jgi:hypothetical protein